MVSHLMDSVRVLMSVRLILMGRIDGTVEIFVMEE
jgi:hypothetical protein